MREYNQLYAWNTQQIDKQQIRALFMLKSRVANKNR